MNPAAVTVVVPGFDVGSYAAEALDSLRDQTLTAWRAVPAGQSAAVQARTAQILRMDVPRLAAIARTHPDDAYRRALGVFARGLWARPGAAQSVLDEASAAVVAAARLW